jgi:cytochrome c oxidase subunit 2
LKRRAVIAVWLLLGSIAALASCALAFSAWDEATVRIDDLDVRVTGFDYRFEFRSPGADQQFGSADDIHGVQDLHVPEGARVHLELTSDDYVYVFEIPQLDVYEIVAPDVTFSVDFQAPAEGNYRLLGNQMCGYEHESLLGELIVHRPTHYRRAIEQSAAQPTPHESR